MKSSFKQELANKKELGLIRDRIIRTSAQKVIQYTKGKEKIAFLSNDYLGLANNFHVKEAIKKACDKYGVGSGASHVVNGHTDAHRQLEEKIAAKLGYEKVLLFSTGYMANLGALTALTKANDIIFQDRYNHASLLDAGILAQANSLRYKHNDLANLEIKLQKKANNRFIITDGIFSVDGDIAPLKELATLAKKYSATLIVDDAHAFGVIGQNGSGSRSYHGLSTDELPITIGTLGKAIGTFGAFIAANEEIIEYIAQTARSYIYTTAMPPSIAAATIAALNVLEQEPERLNRIKANINYFIKCANDNNLQITNNATPIQLMIIGDNKKACALGALLEDAGFLVGIIRPPTVPKDTSRLRITLCSEHKKAQIEGLITAIVKAKKILGD